jgi:hypothetical protein
MLHVIHMTTAYSNAVVSVMLPQFSDFAKKLDLPVPQPITTNMVAKSYPYPVKELICGSVTLTNGYWFNFDYRGYVDSFRAPDNPFHKSYPSSKEYVERFVGKVNMTTNEALALAQNAIHKLGYGLEHFGKLKTFSGPGKSPLTTNEGGVMPYCEILWEQPSEREALPGYINVQIDMHNKTLIGMSIMLPLKHTKTNHIGTPLKVDVEPELESDYKKRMGGGMYIPTKLDE